MEYDQNILIQDADHTTLRGLKFKGQLILLVKILICGKKFKHIYLAFHPMDIEEIVILGHK